MEVTHGHPARSPALISVKSAEIAVPDSPTRLNESKVPTEAAEDLTLELMSRRGGCPRVLRMSFREWSNTAFGRAAAVGSLPSDTPGERLRKSCVRGQSV